MVDENGTGTDEPRGPTKRVVLKRERVLVLGDDVTLAQVAACADEKALRKLLVARAGSTQKYEVEAWVVIGTFDGASKRTAIEQYAGKPKTADAKAGDYKAPSVSAWSGGERYKRPPVPLFERESLEDVIAP